MLYAFQAPFTASKAQQIAKKYFKVKKSTHCAGSACLKFNDNQ